MICTDLKTGKSFSVCPDRPFLPALGNFDGVHLAHSRLIGLARQLRDRCFPNATVCAWFFSESPAAYQLGQTPEYLTLHDEKCELLAHAGAEYAIEYPFPVLRNMDPNSFIQRILISECHAIGAVCGYNFRFGKDAAGTPDLLQNAFREHFSLLPEVEIDGQTISSTAIRNAIKSGNVSLANRMLGYEFSISSDVTHGKHLGTSLGIPTVNQTLAPQLVVPCHGVYITQTVIDGTVWRSVTNVGVRPTVEQSCLVNCETHLLDCSADLYGKNITVRFLKFIRPEQKFESQKALQNAIQHDILEAKSYFQ